MVPNDVLPIVLAVAFLGVWAIAGMIVVRKC